MHASRPVTGIDGCAGGWIAATLDGEAITWAASDIEGIGTLVRGVTGIDIPIGLVDEGWREWDLAARTRLGAASSRVFMTPPRAVLELGPHAPNDDVQRLCRELTGQGVSRQALALAPRILAVDRLLAERPDLEVYEVFPEFSFEDLAGSLLAPKKTGKGVGQRIAALLTWRPDIADVLATAPPRVPVDDCLDALACLWRVAH